MSQAQSQGLGGLSYKSTNDLSGSSTDVTNGNPIGSTNKNAVGLGLVVDTANAVSVIVAGANVKIVGVCLNTPKAADPAQIASVRGTSCKALAGGVVSIGDRLETDSSGRFVTSTVATHKISGFALESASAAGNLFEMVLIDDVHE